MWVLVFGLRAYNGLAGMCQLFQCVQVSFVGMVFFKNWVCGFGSLGLLGGRGEDFGPQGFGESGVLVLGSGLWDFWTFGLPISPMQMWVAVHVKVFLTITSAKAMFEQLEAPTHILGFWDLGSAVEEPRPGAPRNLGGGHP